MPGSDKKTSIFLRISLTLLFPLLLLISAFTAIQLTNQFSFLHKFYEVQSRVSINGMSEYLTQTLNDPENFKNPLLLRANFEKAKELYRVSQLLVFDPLTRDILFSDKKSGFSSDDLIAAEQTLLDKKNGKPPLFLIDKRSQRLNAFTAIASPTMDRTYVAKVSFPLGNMKLALEKSMGGLIAMFLLTLLAGFLIAAALSRSIIKPLRTLNQATRDILKGQLGQKVSIHTGDEIEELAETFNQMSINLKAMKERAEDANPLTQLPGNNGIYHEVQKRIFERQKFVFFHIDLDRFKIFNDHYGLARGDEVIRKTAKVLIETIGEKGKPGDFLGHQGGDDFVILAAPQRAKEIAEAVIQAFDQILRTIYRKEDYERGHILCEDRRSEPGKPSYVKFPLMAISLAGITNVRRDFADYFDLLSRAVSVKKRVKSDPKSCYEIEE